MHSGKKSIGKSNVSSLNYDLSPLENTPVLGSGSPAVDAGHAAAKSVSTSASVTTNSSRIGTVENSPDSALPAQMHHANSNSHPYAPPPAGYGQGAQNQNPNIAHMHVPAPAHAYGHAHREWVESPHAGAYVLPSAGSYVPPPIRPFQSLHGHGQSMDDPLIMSLEQQRHVAMQLLANQTQHAGFNAPRSVHNSFSEYRRENDYGFSNIPHTGQHPITSRDHAPNVVHWQEGSPYAQPSRYGNSYNAYQQQHHVAQGESKSAQDLGGPGNGHGGGVGGFQQLGPGYHAGIANSQPGHFHPQLHGHQSLSHTQSQAHAQVQGGSSQGHAQTDRALPALSSLSSPARTSGTDSNHRLLMSDGKTNVHDALHRSVHSHNKDIRLKDSTHGRSRALEEKEAADAISAAAQQVADAEAAEAEKAQLAALSLKRQAKNAPQNVHPGQRYHGESLAVVPGEKPVTKKGVLWLNHLGVRQRCLLEASQTVFKGDLAIYLMNAKGEAFRDKPVGEFLLGAVGDMTVTLSGSNISLQDSRNAVLLHCADDEEAEEWYVCISVVIPSMYLRQLPHFLLLSQKP